MKLKFKHNIKLINSDLREIQWKSKDKQNSINNLQGCASA